MTTNVVITGANRGIGLAFVKEYLERECEVTAICRTASEALQETPARIIEGIDVADAKSIHELAVQLDDLRIDVLINNAGILRSENFGEINYETILEQFTINSIGPLRVTEALAKNLVKGSKIGLITSRMGSIEDNGSGAYYGYRMSKAALNAAGKSLALDMASKGVAVAILHPGFVQTDMVNNSGDIPAETAAERLALRIDELTMENSGSFWHSNGESLPW